MTLGEYKTFIECLFCSSYSGTVERSTTAVLLTVFGAPSVNGLYWERHVLAQTANRQNNVLPRNIRYELRLFAKQ